MKGCQKRVVFLKNTGSPVFEEAYFIVRADKNGAEICKKDGDIVSEASRIVDEMLGKKKREGSGTGILCAAFFLFGAVLGIVLTLVLA